MFGYIKIYQPELKVAELEHYRGVYCALCRTLAKRYGLFAQWSLSYDFTFLALLQLSLSQDCPGFHKKRCPYHPLKKRSCCCSHTALDNAADAAVLLTYHKLKDTIADSGFFKSFLARLLLPFAAADRRRCQKHHPDWDEKVTECMDKQRKVEQAHSPSPDEAAEPTAELLSFLFSVTELDPSQARVLARLGYCMGRWIYMADALDDREHDRKTGNYNPLLAAAGTTADGDAVRVRAIASLNGSLAECKAAYELLNICRFDGILRNVLEWGMPSVQQQLGIPKKERNK